MEASTVSLAPTTTLDSPYSRHPTPSLGVRSSSHGYVNHGDHLSADIPPAGHLIVCESNAHTTLFWSAQATRRRRLCLCPGRRSARDCAPWRQGGQSTAWLRQPCLRRGRRRGRCVVELGRHGGWRIPARTTMSCLDSVDAKYLDWVMALTGSEAAGVGSWVTPGFIRMGLSMLSVATVDGQGPRRGQKADHWAYLWGGDGRGRGGGR